MKIHTRISKNNRELKKTVKKITEGYMAIRGWASGLKSRKIADIKEYRGKTTTEK